MHLYQWVFSGFGKLEKVVMQFVFMKQRIIAPENEWYETRNNVDSVKLFDGIGSL